MPYLTVDPYWKSMPSPWYGCPYPLTLDHVGQYLATKGEDDIVGIMTDPSGCLLAQTLNWLYPDKVEVTRWQVSTHFYQRTATFGCVAPARYPLAPELAQLVDIFDHVRDTRNGRLITKAQLRQYLISLGASHFLEMLFPANVSVRGQIRMEEPFSYRDWMDWTSTVYGNSPSSYALSDPTTWMVTKTEPTPELFSLASVLEEAETTMGTLTEKKKAMESVKEQIAELELALV